MLTASKRLTNRRLLLGIEVLESRDPASSLIPLGLPATPSGTAALSAGKLTITDESTAARIRVVLDDGDLQVYDGTVEIGTFASPSVSSITVNVGDGSNEVIIGETVTQQATINANGTGSNKLVGGGGTTTLNGGSGSNVLIGSSGTTTFNEGSGTNVLLNVTSTDAVNPAAGTTKVLQDNPTPSPPAPAPEPTLTVSQVQQLLNRAQAASSYNNAIIAVTDRNGQILGVRVESGVNQALMSNVTTSVFAIDGAVSLARTGALFGNDQSPLTSRTVQFLSQSTITQREVESNPNIANQNSTSYGPGYVAPVGVGGNFPPGIDGTPDVDLFEIEQTNREGIYVDGVQLSEPYNINPAYVGPTGQLYPLNSYGVASGELLTAQNRGIATLPGGIPIVENGQVVGGIGVFFPGATGFADAENSALSSTYNPKLPDMSAVAEWMSFAAVGGFTSSVESAPVAPIGAIGGVPAMAGFGLTDGFITLGGITLPLVGAPGLNGFDAVLALGKSVGTSTPVPSEDVPVDTKPASPDILPSIPGNDLMAGDPTPTGWLVEPHSGVGITQAQVEQIVEQGLAQAAQTRSAIRLPLNTPGEFVIAVTDNNGNVVGLYREPDATMFSVDVAIAKARNDDYYDNPAELQTQDKLWSIPAGTAFTSRTFRYLAEPLYPEGIQGSPPGPFSQLTNGGASLTTGLQVGPVLPPSAYTSVVGYTSFHPDANFHDPNNPLNQNGVVYFPGSAPLYAPAKSGGPPVLSGGLGVSGDGVDEDDVATVAAQAGFTALPPGVLRADQTYYSGVRLPYQNYDRNPDL